MYGRVQMVVGAFVLILVGMCIGGDGHQAASIVSHIFSPLMHHPVLSTVLIIGIVIGCWAGHERAIARLGEAEMKDIRKAIRAGGDD